MKAIILALLIGCGGGMGGAPTSHEICGLSVDDGTACSGTATCAGGDCRDFRTCACDGFRYHCEHEELTDGASCAGLEGAQCSIEGGTACNSPPPSGGCNCVDQGWECFTTCPDGCPDFRPTDGAPCTLEANVSCPYLETGLDRVDCTCSAGGFVCN